MADHRDNIAKPNGADPPGEPAQPSGVMPGAWRDTTPRNLSSYIDEQPPRRAGLNDRLMQFVGVMALLLTLVAALTIYR